jgi:cytoskeletal protein RodZ
LDPARTEQHNFDDALKKRAKEKLLWTVLSVVAGVTLIGWIGGTIFYVASMVEDDTPVQGHAPIAKVVAPTPGDPTPSATTTATTTAKPETKPEAKPKGAATTKPASTKPEAKPEASTKPASSSSAAHH